MDRKRLLLLASGTIIGCMLGILISAVIGGAWYFTSYGKEIEGYKANMGGCDSRLTMCKEEFDLSLDEQRKCREGLEAYPNDISQCRESLDVCTTDLNLCLGKSSSPSGVSRTRVSTIPVTTIRSSSRQEEISPDRVKNFVNRMKGINSLSSNAVFIFDITDVGKYTVRKTSSGIQVSKGESSERDIVVRVSKYYFEVLERSSDFCGKARQLYDEQLKKLWYEELNKQKVCGKGYDNIYFQCIPGGWWERQAVRIAC